MKLSIIVPVYKVEEYLGECVDSLLSQTIDDYEVILVDDGSPDNSGKIADEYAAANPDMIRVLHIDNGGQGRARNFALDIAKGDFVGFVDSDDWVTHDMYEKMYTCARVCSRHRFRIIGSVRQARPAIRYSGARLSASSASR